MINRDELGIGGHDLRRAGRSWVGAVNQANSMHHCGGLTGSGRAATPGRNRRFSVRFGVARFLTCRPVIGCQVAAFDPVAASGRTFVQARLCALQARSLSVTLCRSNGRRFALSCEATRSRYHDILGVTLSCGEGGTEMKKLIHEPVPVAAACTLRYPTFIIKKGTPGEVTGVEGTRPTHYTVTFWPNGCTGARSPFLISAVPSLWRPDLA